MVTSVSQLPVNTLTDGCHERLDDHLRILGSHLCVEAIEMHACLMCLHSDASGLLSEGAKPSQCCSTLQLLTWQVSSIPVDLAVVQEVCNVCLAGGAGLDHLLGPQSPSSLGPPIQYLALPLQASHGLVCQGCFTGIGVARLKLSHSV